MSAKNLIEIASSKGLGIGRNRSNEYRYGYSDWNEHKEFVFAGTWNQFVKFICAFEPKNEPRTGS